MGSVSEFHAAIRAAFISTTRTSIPGAFSAIIAIVGPPTYPAPIQQIFIQVRTYSDQTLSTKVKVSAPRYIAEAGIEDGMTLVSSFRLSAQPCTGGLPATLRVPSTLPALPSRPE